MHSTESIILLFMKKSIYYIKYIITFCSLLLIGTKAYANTDKYRIILTNDPSSSITIAWNQISGSNPVVYYDIIDHGTNIAAYNNSATIDRIQSYRGMNNHFARISGLTPNTSYYFVIGDDEGVSSRYWFKTTPSDNSRLSFIAGGDSRNNRGVRQDANTLVSKLKPHAVFFGGDMTSSDNSTQWQEWMDDWQNTISSDGRMIPIVPARGNHENSNTIYNLFDVPIEDEYFAMTFGDNFVRTYTLNSEISEIGDQLTWLTDDLSTNTSARWKMIQYHKPMRPHTSAKSEGNSEYNAWAQLFFDNQVNLVIDCDSHMSKTTWPIKPTSAAGNDEGFVRNDENGTVYAGEGCWGAPLRPSDDDKTWTRNSGSFNQFKLLFIDMDTIEMRTIKIENIDMVAEVDNDDPFTLPTNLSIWNPSNGDVVEIYQPGVSPCSPEGTPCNDGDPQTFVDVEDGQCNCIGIPFNGTTETFITNPNDDAEQAESGGNMYMNSSDIELVYDNYNNQGNQFVGLKFNDIHLPSNAVIANAYIQFTAENNHSADASNIIHGEFVGDAITFSDNDFDISTRTLTNSSISWEIPAWTTPDAGQDQQTPDISNIVQEILSHQDWIPRNGMAFIITGSGRREAFSYDGNPIQAPRLIIEYELCFENLTIDWLPVRGGSYRATNDIILQSTINSDTSIILHHGPTGKVIIPGTSTLGNNSNVILKNDGCNGG